VARGEHRSTGERKYYLSNLPADTPIRQLADAIKARWTCEQGQATQGGTRPRSLRRSIMEGAAPTRADMSMIALAFLQTQRLKQARGEKHNRRAASAAQFADDQASHH